MAEESPGTKTARDGAALSDPTAAAAAVSRARFLSGATAGIGAVLGAAILVPTVGFGFGPSFVGEKWYWTNIGSAEAFPFDAKQSPDKQTLTPVKFTRDPTEGILGARVAFVRRTAQSVADGTDTGSFIVISNTCMHMGCPVQETLTGFGCPCHGGQYDLQGARIGGPPVRPLNRYSYKIEKGDLYLGRVYASEEKDGKVVMTNEWRDPGQPVNGLLSFLYPPAPR